MLIPWLLLGGFFMTAAIEKRMKAKNRGAAGDVIDNWNHVSISPMRYPRDYYLPSNFSVLFRASQNGGGSLSGVGALERP